MNIIEALKTGNGKAMLECLPDDYVYVCIMELNNHDKKLGPVFGDVLIWNKTRRPAVRSFYLRTDWLPYQPEPKKCEALKT